MIIYVRENELIKKYNVEYSHSEVANLRLEIIDKCSNIVHHEENLSCRLMDTDSLKIRNIKRSAKPVGSIDYGVVSEEAYHYSYDEYVYPELVYIINELLEGDPYSLDKLNKYEVPEKENYDDFIKMALKRFDETPLDNIAEKKLILNKMNDYLEKKRLNQNSKPIDEYYTKLMSLISYTLLDSIKVDAVENVMNFFENNPEGIKSVVSKKKLKLQK